MTLVRTYESDAFDLAGCIETASFETTYTYGTTPNEWGDLPFSIAEPGPTERVRTGCAVSADDGSSTIPGSVALGGFAYANA